MTYQAKLPFKKNRHPDDTTGPVNPTNQPGAQQRNHLKDIADTTLKALEAGSITSAGISYDLAANIRFSNHNTRYYPPNDNFISTWSSNAPKSSTHALPKISILDISTLDGARLLHDKLSSRSTSYGRIAVLNFASATRPGGGFLGGAQAQEESIARSSTLYPSLMTDVAQQFYQLHGRDRKGGFYYHAMVYTPSVVVVRNDGGDWVSPFEIDVLTSAAVNAGDVRSKNNKGERINSAELESKINTTMMERMARVLFLMEQQGAKNIVLGSFGTGVFRNNVEVVARIWADLLTGQGARYKHSFDRVVFAILGMSTYSAFGQAFRNSSTQAQFVR
ncbi:hypothetical protein PAXRUDRAFT_32794 [Paxillus rubicundulus Ve08.2h10]|uniref:Microbial-type PARG catalytic domain-containing protein n=1 Tax=Paxillus rubicundulus Ve08.2h10 TaxID=930991 RepID=A0A0D0DRM1_9AGAM|nr:hypothetical protein PAXRUDRAFT_32794 [Paxillus rubicundulus Ve08.2h10]